MCLNSVTTCAGSTTGLAANGNGTLLYEASYGSPGCVSSFTPSGPPDYLTPYNANTSDSNSHDVALGICAPGTSCGYGGNMLTSDFSAENAYVVNEYMPTPLHQPLLLLEPPPPFIPPYPSNCANFAGVGTECWNHVSGMAFDNSGNLWANNSGAPNGTFEFAPGGNCGATLCPLNFVQDSQTNGEPIGLTVAPSTDPDNPGKVLVADLVGVNIIDPMSCRGTLANPGTCLESPFIKDSTAEPKYVVYSEGCPNPDNNGYVEICKQGNPEYPPPNQLYDFTATAPLFSSGTIQVPLGECSGAIEVPSGQVTITEAPTIGVLVSDVTACSYNVFGECVPDLISWTQPDLFATVPVTQGGVSSETLTTFTNYAASPGQLKVCKIAGLGTPVGGGIEYTFNVTGAPPFQLEAGPADQGGFCQLVAGTFPVNTPVTIAETLNASYPLTNATVECNACTYSINLPQYSVTTTIGAGITVASFTNTKKNNGCLICRVPGTE